MTPELIKLDMHVMTKYGKGVVVAWRLEGGLSYLVKIEGHKGHNGEGVSLIAGSDETLDGDGYWFNAEDLTAIEEPTQYSEWKTLTPMPDEKHPNEKVGSLFVVVKYHLHFNKGKIVKLVENDKSNGPRFESIKGCEKHPCAWFKLAKLPQSETQIEEKKMKTLIPFTDEFDWCEEGVLVMINGLHERYAVRAKGEIIWTVDDGKKLCDISHAGSLTTHSRLTCQKVTKKEYRPLTNKEFSEFMQDHKGCVRDTSVSMIFYHPIRYHWESENISIGVDLLFRFSGTEEWHPVTTELYEIAKSLYNELVAKSINKHNGISE